MLLGLKNGTLMVMMRMMKNNFLELAKRDSETSSE